MRALVPVRFLAERLEAVLGGGKRLQLLERLLRLEAKSRSAVTSGTRHSARK